MMESGNPRENAMAERISGILKSEWITFAMNCNAIAGRRQKCQVYAGRSSKFRKVF
jgi:transposase InsO family protein